MSRETKVGTERKGEEGLRHALITDQMTQGNYNTTLQFYRGNDTINSRNMLQVSIFLSLHMYICDTTQWRKQTFTQKHKVQ